MSPGLITSFVIGGMLMLSIIMMNLRISGSSQELTLTLITREHVSNVADMLNDDIPNMGYDVDGPSNPIVTIAEDEKIQFYRNVYNDIDRDPELITWELLDEEVSGTENSGHRVLVRIEQDAATGVEKKTEIRTGVTVFRLRYLDRHGNDKDDANAVMQTPVPASERSDIKQIYLELEMQSAEPVHGGSGAEGRYIRSVYEKRYSPGNLDLN